MPLESPRFERLRRVGRGGSGEVALALDRRLGTRVALKSVGRATGEPLLRFKDEFRTIRDLAHPNVVRLDELFDQDGEWFYSMEYIEGRTFFEHVRDVRVVGARDERSGSLATVSSVGRLEAPWSDGHDSDRAVGHLEESVLRHALVALCETVTALHALGKVHCDLKDDNVLVTSSGRVVVIDFGLAMRLGGEQSSVEGIAGTPAYMAPEQVTGHGVGPASDWYAVGVMLYRALAGCLPFDGHPLSLLARKHRESPPLPSTRTSAPISNDLEALCMSLLAIDPAERPTGADILRHLAVGLGTTRDEPPDDARLDVPFVGRGDELRTIADALRAARAKEARQVLIFGESGIGKSALVREAAARLRASTGEAPWVLTAACHEREQVRYNALDGVVDALARELPRRVSPSAFDAIPPSDAALLCLAFPTLAKVEALARRAFGRDGAPIDPESLTGRQALARAVRAFFGILTGRATVVLVLEDVHWADDGSFALLHALAHGPDRPPLLIVATARHELRARASEPDVRRFLALDSLETVPLGPLDGARAHALAESWLGEHAGRIDPIDLPDLVRSANGHPLFLELLCTSATPRVARSLDDAIAERFERVPPVARELLFAASVALAPITPSALARASGVDAELVPPFLRWLRDERWLRASSGAEAGRIDLYHDQLRSHARRAIGDERKRAVHGALARALRDEGAGPDKVATHFAEAGDFVEATECAIAAAKEAEAAFAFDRAVSFYSLAREHARLEPSARRALEVAHADVLARAGQAEAAARTFLSLAEDESVAADRALPIRGAILLLSSGHLEEGKARLERTARSLGVSIPRSMQGALVRVMLDRARFGLFGLRPRVREDATPSIETRLRCDLLAGASHVLGVVDPILGSCLSLAYVKEALASGHLEHTARAMGVEAAMRAYMGDVRDAEGLLARAEALAARSTDDGVRASLFLHRAAIRSVPGDDFRAMLGASREALAILARTGSTEGWEQTTARFLELSALANAGSYAELERLATAYLADGALRGDRFAHATLASNPTVTLRHLIADRPERVELEVDEALAVFEGGPFLVSHYMGLLARTHADLYGGDPERAIARIDAVRAELDRSMVLRMPALRSHLAVREVGARLVLRGRSSARSRDDRRTVARWLTPPRLPPDVAAIHHAGYATLRAAARAQDGDLPEAIAALESARSTFERCGARAYVAACSVQLGALRGNEHGEAERADGLEFLVTSGVRHPFRFVAALLPGFEHVESRLGAVS